MLNVAVPETVFPVPKTVPPLLKVMTSPSGIDPYVEVTVAVKVKDCPTKTEFEEETKTVVVAAGNFFTT